MWVRVLEELCSSLALFRQRQDTGSHVSTALCASVSPSVLLVTLEAVVASSAGGQCQPLAVRVRHTDREFSEVSGTAVARAGGWWS